MAEALLSFGVERLWNLLVRETGRFQRVGEQFDGLKSDVEMLRCFLEDAEAKKHTSAMVRKTIEDIKEIVFDAEDIIETYLLKKELGKSSSSRNSVRRIAYVTVKRMGLASDMKTIRTRISKAIRDMQSFGVEKIIVNEEYTQSLQKKQREIRQTFSRDDEDHLVGLEGNVEKLVGVLMEEDSSQVVCVTGMGGIGKTTLARQVFNHETIKSHFPGLVWVCVSQQFERKYVWQTILRQLRPECEVSNMMEEELQEKIVKVLETKKSLIVIDDIWRDGDWDRIKHVFLPKKGCKLLLTSRNEGVALHADKQCFTFRPECLTFEKSWELFQRIVFPMRDTAELKIDEEMKELGKKMIKHCGGLPLAVKVLGGLLASQYTLGKWERVYKNIGSHIIGGASFSDRNISSVYHVLYLSFEELPIYLKQCFLYLAHFPEDYQIDVEDLSYYWAAEGITSPRHNDGANIRDVADGFIAELVKRNMVISERDVDTSRFETCQLHDMMREVCLRKAEEENFVQIIQGTSTANSKSPCKSRKLVVHKPYESFDVETEVNIQSLRALLFINNSKWDARRWKATSLFFTRHKLMRVLDLLGVEFKEGEVPSIIGKLIHLRYLSLRKAHVTHLPSSMRNLKQLLYLNLDVRYNVVYIPNFLKEMRELTYLWLPETLHGNVKIDLGNLVKLETLENFSTEHGSVSDLQGMTRLRILSIHIRGKACSMNTISSSLSKITHLETLTIDDNNDLFAPTNDDDEGFVWNFVHLRHLRLSIYMPRLPDAQSFPSHLSTIHLQQCRLKEDPMPILEKLSQLKNVRLWHESFSGRRMICSKDGFPQLHKLEFDGLEEWEEWIVEEGSMPLLHTLDIQDCEKWEKWIVEKGSMLLLHTLRIEFCWQLKELPDGLRFITSLEDLSLQHMGEELKLKCLPSHLTTITLMGCRMEEDPMPILEKLVQLKEVLLAEGSFCGRRICCSKGGFPQLKKLKLENLNEWEEWIVEEGSMPLLHSLEINNCRTFKEIPDGLRFLTSLEDLMFSGMGKEWKNILYMPSHLTTISLSGCPLKEDPMLILEKLVQVKEVNLLDQSFCGRRMVCSRGGFPQLHRLLFHELEHWEEWIVEEGSMPLLHSLTIRYCPKLKEIPDGLQFITSLERLTCYFMGEEWKRRLTEGGEDYHKVQHIPYVEFL